MSSSASSYTSAVLRTKFEPQSIIRIYTVVRGDGNCKIIRAMKGHV